MISDQKLRAVLRSDGLVHMMGDLARGVLFVGVAGAIVRYLLHYATAVREMITGSALSDFGKFYYATRAFLDGGAMYGPTPATHVVLDAQHSIELWDMNPPQFHLLLLPIARLDPVTALAIWAIVNLAALAVSLHLIARELRLRFTMPGVMWTLLAVLAFSATETTIITGQLTFLILLLMTIAWVAARRGRWQTSAIALGIAASIKPFLGIFLVYFVVRRQMKAAAAMIATIAVCVGAGVAVFGWQAYVGWVGVLSSITWFWTPMNVSIGGLLARMLDESAFFTPVAMAPAVVRPAAAVIGAGIGVFTLVVTASDRSSDAIDRAFVALLLAALLISPLGSVYYLWFIAGPAFALWLSSRSQRSRARDIFVLLAIPGLVWPVVLTTLWGRHPLPGATIGSIYTWTTLWLWAAALKGTGLFSTGR